MKFTLCWYSVRSNLDSIQLAELVADALPRFFTMMNIFNKSLLGSSELMPQRHLVWGHGMQ